MTNLLPCQLDLFDRPAIGPSGKGGLTSWLAALDNAPRASDQRRRCLLAHYSHPGGLTDYELAQAIAHPRPHVAGTRRKELEDLGLIERTERTRPTDTLSQATVWKVTPLGVKYATRTLAAERSAK
jgi:hypothetical protein